MYGDRRARSSSSGSQLSVTRGAELTATRIFRLWSSILAFYDDRGMGAVNSAGAKNRRRAESSIAFCRRMKSAVLAGPIER